MKYNHTGLYLILLGGVFFSFLSCSKMDSTYREFIKDGTIIYTGMTDSLKAFGGNNRVKLQWQISDPAISKCIVRWAQEGVIDSAVVPVVKLSGKETFEVLLEDIPENTYTFYVTTYDRDGNSSVVKEISGVVYGDDYMSSLHGRQIKSIEYSEDGSKLLLNWHNAGEGNVGTELKYNDKDGEEQTLTVLIDEKTTVIEDFDYATLLTYQSAFLPDSTALDTFFTAPVITSLPKLFLKLKKSDFVEVYQPGDINEKIYSTNALTKFWDDDIFGTSWYCSTTSGLPQLSFTFDMGVSARLSHFRTWQRFKDNQANGFNNANPKIFEIWGRNDEPDADGSWTNWSKLGTFEIIKPSGLPRGQLAAADIQALEDGHEFTFPEDIPPVRYLRILVLERWDAPRKYVYWAEMTLYRHPK